MNFRVFKIHLLFVFFLLTVRLRTRQSNPEANIMAKHRASLLSFTRKPNSTAELLPTRLRELGSPLATLFDQKSGVKSAPKRTHGTIDMASARFAASEEIPNADKIAVRQITGSNSTSWRPVKKVAIGGVQRIPKKFVNTNSTTISHDFLMRKKREKRMGTIEELFALERCIVARVRLYKTESVAMRSELPLIRITKHTTKLVSFKIIGEVVVFAKPSGRDDDGSGELRVVIPTSRGYI